MSRSLRLAAALSIAPLLHLSRPAPRAGEGDDDDKDEEKEASKRRNLERLLAKKNGDAVAVAAQLLAENANLREDKRSLNKTITDLQAKVPGDGVVVLSEAEVKEFAAFKELGTPDELKTLQGERDDFKTKCEAAESDNAKTKRDLLLRDVADAVAPGQKFKLPVLAKLDADRPGLSYELKEVEENGQKSKRAFVKFKDGEGENAPLKEMALLDFAQEQWSDFLPALKVEPETATGTRHVAQGSGGAPAGGTVYDRIRREADDKKKATATEGPSLEERLHMRPAGTASAA